MTTEQREPRLGAYRIGWWTHRWWPNHYTLRGLVSGRDPAGRPVPRWFYARQLPERLRLLRRPHRPWQAEWSGCRRAVRAFTRTGALKKAARRWAESL